METKTFVTAEQRQAKQVDELKDLQERQQRAANGDKTAIKKIEANKDKKFKIDETDKDYVHVYAMTKNLAPDNKSFLESSSIIKLHPNQVKQMIDANAFAGYDDVKIIHDPRPNPPAAELKPAEPKYLGDADRDQAAAFAAQEQKLKDAEGRIDEKLKRLEELEAKLAAATVPPAETKTKTGKDAEKLPPPPQG